MQSLNELQVSSTISYYYYVLPSTTTTTTTLLPSTICTFVPNIIGPVSLALTPRTRVRLGNPYKLVNMLTFSFDELLSVVSVYENFVCNQFVSRPFETVDFPVPTFDKVEVQTDEAEKIELQSYGTLKMFGTTNNNQLRITLLRL